MSRNQTLKLFGLAVAVLLLVVAGSESLSYALGDAICGCSPTTPCPCAADGVCRPKRQTWGHYTTRWRTWPGEQRGRGPTPADEAPGAEEQLDPLPDYETPLPEQEDLRVPPKAKKKKADDESSEPLELPGEAPGQLLPGPEAAPGDGAPLDLDPFGQLPAIPAMEDAPPALPASLRQAAISMGMPRVTMQRQPSMPQQPRVVQASATQPIRQADWQSSAPIQLINPAAAIKTSATAEPLQQAVYYEASDLEE